MRTRRTATWFFPTTRRRPRSRCSRSTTTTCGVRTERPWARSIPSIFSTCARAASPSRPPSGRSCRVSSGTYSSGSRSSTHAGLSRPSSRRVLARYRVASVDEVPVESLKKVEAGRTPVCLAHAGDGNFYALNDTCTHEEFSLSEGELWEMDVECPQHGSRFNLVTGKVTGLPAVIPATTYPVSVDGDEIFIEVPE